MLLVIDIGNTTIAMSLFDGKEFISTSKMAHFPEINSIMISDVFTSVLGKVNLEGCIISSVVEELTEVVFDAVKDTYKVNALILSSDLEISVNLNVKNPELIGSDRLANMCAASALYNKYPLVIIDSGSATTFDVLDKNGDFIGGLIMPGFAMQLQSLHEHTSKLPVIELENKNKAHKVMCTTTKSQILSGVIRGHICSIEGLLEQCVKELGEKPFVVITGGGAGIIQEFMAKDKYDVINQMLTLEGARLIYESNMD